MHTPAGAKHPCLPWKGVAERSESFKIMIAGGNHSTVERCRTNVRRRGLFVERYKPIILHRPVGVANLATRCGAAAQKLTEVSSSLHGTSSRNCPLASPGGKLPDLTALRNRQGWLMRGGDRLVQECSWMSGICSGFLHSTEKSITFSHHHALMGLAALCNTPERAE